MQKITFTATVAALLLGASAAEAQRAVAARDVPPGHRPPPGMCRIWIDGVPPGRQPGVTDCATAQARAPWNSRIIYGDRTPFPGNARGRSSGDCRFEQSRGPTLGEIIFGRRNGDRDCRWDDRRQTGAWYEVGRDAYGNTIYQRTVRSRDGSIVLQRARRDRNGRMVVLETRHPDSRVVRGGLTDDEVWGRSRRGNGSRVSGDDDWDRRGNARLASNDKVGGKPAKVKSKNGKRKGKGRN